jgi:hypothetical protein
MIDKVRAEHHASAGLRHLLRVTAAMSRHPQRDSSLNACEF